MCHCTRVPRIFDWSHFPNPTVGLEDYGEILMLVKYDNNQTVRLCEMSSQSLQYSVKIGEYLIKVGEPSKLGL